MLKVVLLLAVLGGLGFLGYQNQELILSYVNQEPSDVVVLTESNFDNVIKENEFVLVEFYAPWCGHCKSLAPHYERAASHFKFNNSTVVIAKVDATVHKSLGERFEVKGFPTLKWFNKGEPSEYTGGRDFVTIVSWVNKKSGDFSINIKSVEQFDKVTEQNKCLVVLFTQEESGDLWDIYKSVGTTLDKPQFAHISDSDLAQHLNKQFGNIVVYKQFDEKVVDFTGNFDSESITNFVSQQRIPTVLEFDDSAIELVFQSKLASLLMFHDEEEKSLEARKAFDALAQQQKINGEKMIFSYSRPTDASNHFNKLGEFVGADLTSLPAFSLLDTTTGKIVKFQFNGEPTLEGLSQFVNDFNNGVLKPTLKSEEIPVEQNEAVRVVVGKSFQQEVIDTPKDVLVKYYATWCGHCKNLAPHWDAAAEKLLKNENIVIAKMDATLNEVEGLDIQGFPTLKFYPGNDKYNVIDYKGERSTEGIINWLKENTTHPWVALEEEKQEEKEEKQPEQDL